MRTPSFALEPILRRILLASTAAVAACGGQVVSGDGGPLDAGSDARADAGLDAKPDATACLVTIVQPGDMNACQDRVLEISGAPALCGLPAPDSGTGIEQSVCEKVCGWPNLIGCYWSSPNQVTCSNCAVGRLPGGLAARELPPRGGLGGYFAEMARLEAAAVFAFEHLEVELRAHGAPAALVEGARRSQGEEITHARLTRALAERFGGAYEAPRAQCGPVRDLEAMARENAVEGCVRETFGALVAMWQAEHAEDQGVREALATIARDELAHADLSWEIARWIEPQLGAAARARVDAARAEAVRALRDGACGEQDQALVAVAGLPDAAAARALFGGLEREIWAAAA